MKKLVLTLLALFLIAFAVWPSALVKTSTISSSYTLSESVKSKIKNETTGMDELKIIRYSLNLTSDMLEFAQKNDISRGKANCVGYAALCKAISEYAY